MARGTIAKENVIKIIQQAFGNDYIGEYDKKLYVQASDGGETVQIAISLTCPKNPMPTTSAQKLVSLDGQGFDFTAEPIAQQKANIEFTEEEKQTINDLMAKLGL